MKLQDRPLLDEKLDRLPELPEGMKVPDDISGLEPPATLRASGGATRWMRWLAAIIVLGALAVGAAILTTDGDGTTVEQAEVSSTASQHLEQLEVLGTDGVGATARGHVAQLERLATVPTQAEVYGSDRHLGTLSELGSGRLAYQVDGTASRHLEQLESMAAGQVAVDYMVTYGTDNPVFITRTPYADTGEFLGIDTIGVPQRNLTDTGEFLGIDTITITQPEFVDTGEFLGGGYDVVPPKLSHDMRLYGTDNPVFVEETAHPYADFYG